MKIVYEQPAQQRDIVISDSKLVDIYTSLGEDKLREYVQTEVQCSELAQGASLVSLDLDGVVRKVVELAAPKTCRFCGRAADAVQLSASIGQCLHTLACREYVTAELKSKSEGSSDKYKKLLDKAQDWGCIEWGIDSDGYPLLASSMREENKEWLSLLHKYARHAASNGWTHLADEINARLADVGKEKDDDL